VEAGQDIEMMSSAGEVQINSLLDIHLRAKQVKIKLHFPTNFISYEKQGQIRLESSNIFISGLEQTSGIGAAQYQICVCQNGRLFLANERADCRADKQICS
jgi:hypothetical protein